jgi:hypothetical protein
MLKRLTFTAATLALGCASLLAQTSYTAASSPPSTPAASSAGVINDWLRQENPSLDTLDLGGQFRARYVYQTYFAVQVAPDPRTAVPAPADPTAVDFRANTPHSENDFLLLRTRVHAGYSPTDWLSIFGEGQNSSSTGDKRNPNTQSDGPFDLHQGYVRLGGTKDVPVSVKVGRQELSYGDERLVGAYDWDNNGRVFDAVKLRYEQEKFWVDAFTGRIVIPNDNEFDQPNWDDWFSGVYASSRSLVPKTELQLYFLSDNASGDSPKHVTTFGRGNSPRDIYTVGSRFQTLPGQLHGFDLNGEFAGQFGNYQYPAATPGVVNGERLNHLAYATHIEGGYTFTPKDPKPRLALGFDYGSGDDDPRDKEHNTFVNLYPTNHKFYGAMDFFSWQNLIDPYLKASIAPAKGLTIALTYNAFWLATTSDFMYQVNGLPRTTGYGIQPSNDSFVGQELDLIATYQVKQFLQLQAGYGHFFVGDYVKETFQTSPGGAHDADWVYVQAQVNL